MTPRSATPTAASLRAPPSRTSPKIGSALSVAPAPRTSAPSSRAKPRPLDRASSIVGDQVSFDYDWLVVGSGFGGSVSALRLAEKGYRVAVLECGKRFSDDDFPKSTWDLRRYFWAPRLGMRGIFRMSTFKDVAIVSGSGVGGGSLGYANTLYRARRRFYEDSQWAELNDWETVLAPHYDEAERMLG